MQKGDVVAEQLAVKKRVANSDKLDRHRSQRPATAALRSQAVERAVAAMREQLDQPLPLKAMAGVAALSMHHFARVFRNVTGMPPARFLTALRLAEAKRLLLTTSLTVTDVCYQVGYNSAGSFTTRFTQSVGLSPGRFRRLHRSRLAPELARRQAVGDGVSAPRSCTGQVSGRVHAPGVLPGSVFVGLFRAQIPEGQPAGCAILPALGRYRISGVPDGVYYLFAACFPECQNGLAPLLPDDDSLRVGAGPGEIRIRRGSAAEDADVWLRPLRPTDPPILVVLPAAPPIRGSPNAARGRCAS